MSSQNANIEAPTPRVMAFGDGALGRWIGFYEGMKVGSSWWDWGFIRRATRDLASRSLCRVAPARRRPAVCRSGREFLPGD